MEVSSGPGADRGKNMFGVRGQTSGGNHLTIITSMGQSVITPADRRWRECLNCGRLIVLVSELVRIGHLETDK